MTYPKTLAALRDQDKRSWAVADAVLEEIATHDTGRVLNGEYDRCTAWLSEQGYDITPGYLSSMRATALKFRTLEDRHWKVSFRAYMESAAYPGRWTPELMDRAEREKLTLRQFAELLTGKRWADDDSEAAKRILRDPEKLLAIAGELDPGTLRAIAGMIATNDSARREFYKMDDRRVREILATAGVDKIESDQSKLPTSAWLLTMFDLDLTLVAGRLRRMAQQMSEMDEPVPVRYRQDMLSDVADMRTSLDYIESAVTRDAADWDAAFAELKETE